jgi:hypothetical protein
MALFGDKKPEQDGDTGVEGEVERLGALPLPELASEVMVRGFGPECPADDGRPSVRMITDLLVPGGARLEQAPTRKTALERNTVDQAIGGT